MDSKSRISSFVKGMYIVCVLKSVLICLTFSLPIQLLIFKVIGFIFPTSAFEHSVVTPAMLLMAQLLRKVLPL